MSHLFQVTRDFNTYTRELDMGIKLEHNCKLWEGKVSSSKGWILHKVVTAKTFEHGSYCQPQIPGDTWAVCCCGSKVTFEVGITLYKNR